MQVDELARKAAVIVDASKKVAAETGKTVTCDEVWCAVRTTYPSLPDDEALEVAEAAEVVLGIVGFDDVTA